MNHLASASFAMTLAAATIGMAQFEPARADANAAVCSQGYGKRDGLDCNFANFDQCRASVSGMPATCINNPISAPLKTRSCARATGGDNERSASPGQKAAATPLI